MLANAALPDKAWPKRPRRSSQEAARARRVAGRGPDAVAGCRPGKSLAPITGIEFQPARCLWVRHAPGNRAAV